MGTGIDSLDAKRARKGREKGDRQTLRGQELLALRSEVQGLIVAGPIVTIGVVFGGGCDLRRTGVLSQRTRGGMGQCWRG